MPTRSTVCAAVADEEGQGFLGVECSLSGRRWLARPADARAALALAQRLDLPEIVGRVLAGRGVGVDEAEAFLDPTLRRCLPDPSRLKDMDRGAARLAEAIVRGERVAVFADYDVDGATSAALLSRFLAAIGAPPRLYVPDRLNEGYGPSAAALRALAEEGVRVVVMVDCGTTQHDALAAAAEAGLAVIVADHHAAEGRLPAASAVINPNRLDDTSGQGQLAAVGVTFLLVVAVNRRLREIGYYARRAEPDLRRWLDLVALGTLCDMVPLAGVNRALVSQGLKVMGGWSNPGLKALADGARLKAVPGTDQAGFVLGPRINAGGRVGESALGARLLACDDVDQAAEMAHRLEKANQARREIEAAVLAGALARVAAEEARGGLAPVLVVAGEGWHPGVVGIVAGRLVERFHRPACVLAVDGAVATGSGRSVAGANLGAAVIAARQEGLLLRGGGHPMAAGFSVAVDKVDALRAFLGERLDRQGAAAEVPALYLDGALSVGGASAALTEVLAKIGPFGVGNPEPRFAITAARLASVTPVRGGHLRCVLAGAGGGRLDAIAFRAADTPLGRALGDDRGAVFHFAGRVRANGRWARAQLLIDDAAPLIPR